MLSSSDKHQNYAQRIMGRYNTYWKEPISQVEGNILPIHTAKEQSKCKDYDIDKVDLRSGTKIDKKLLKTNTVVASDNNV